MSNGSIDKWRKKIDELDAELVKLLNERAKFAEEIGKLKSQIGLDAYSPEREEEIMENVAKQNPGPLSLQAIRRLYERIIDESRSVERSAMAKNRNLPNSRT
ncbi:MAG: chorismate mutase [Ignavibacteriales bacterium]|nr:chorismate mutase [Ignavibacteriales bacterium]